MKEPKIRFKGFRGEWEEAPFSEYIFRSIPVHHSGAAVSNLRGKNRLFLMSVRP